MITKDQVKEAFLRDLQTLLDSYNAGIEARDHYKGCRPGEDIRMTVYIPTIWNKITRDCAREGVEIDLGGYMSAAEKGM